MFRTLLPALALSLMAAPAVAETNVSFDIPLEAPAAETLANIQAQAWEACAPTPTSASILDRSAEARRACQKALVRDVVNELADPDVIAALDAREADLKG